MLVCKNKCFSYQKERFERFKVEYIKPFLWINKFIKVGIHRSGNAQLSSSICIYSFYLGPNQAQYRKLQSHQFLNQSHF